MLENKSLDEVTGGIVDACVKLHTNSGPGLLESIYETVLARDLERRGFRVDRQKPVSFEYDGLNFVDALRVDILVESRVIVEIKSVEKLLTVHSKQLLTYLRLLKLPVGILANFGAPSMKEGLHRIVNGLTPDTSPHLRINRPKPE